MITEPAPPAVPTHWVDRAPESALDGRNHRGIRAIAEVLFSTPEGPPAPHRLDWLTARTVALRDAVRGRGMFVFSLCVFIIYWLAPLWSGLPVTLGRLSVQRRAHVLERWERGPFGMTLFAVKAILSIVWCEHPAAAHEMHFDGQPMRAPRLPEADRG